MGYFIHVAMIYGLKNSLYKQLAILFSHVMLVCGDVIKELASFTKLTYDVDVLGRFKGFIVLNDVGMIKS